MPSTRIVKAGAATLAAGAGVILAITSVMAHSTPTATLHVHTKSAIGLLTVAKLDAQKGAAEEQADTTEVATAAAAAEANQDAAEAAAEAQQEAIADAQEQAAAQQEETSDENQNENQTETDNVDQTQEQDKQAQGSD